MGGGLGEVCVCITTSTTTHADVIARYLSCPAVSQICALMRFPSVSMVLVANWCASIYVQGEEMGLRSAILTINLQQLKELPSTCRFASVYLTSLRNEAPDNCKRRAHMHAPLLQWLISTEKHKSEWKTNKQLTAHKLSRSVSCAGEQLSRCLSSRRSPRHVLAGKYKTEMPIRLYEYL